ncbi:rho GTPase-activating protein 7-like [Dendrobates tinctorius]|uniref:rho GTPase-activating protein 7-like n=1 Tax=Dendrobates tinctorius TaxID=92724 RepID=UPI003CC96F12
MSVAVRKKSWEDHVSQWIGLSSNTSGCDKLCCHGIKTKNLKSAMEEHGKEAMKETLSKCIHLEECIGLLEVENQISKEMDENDNLSTEDCSLSSNTSMETFIFLPPNEKELTTKKDELLSSQEGMEVKSLLEEEMSNTLQVSNTSDEVQKNQCTDNERGDTNYKINGDNVNALDEMSFKEMLQGNTDLEETDMSGEQLLNSARIAKQRRKSDGSKVVYEQNVCTDSTDSLCTCLCTSSHLEPSQRTRSYHNASFLGQVNHSYYESHEVNNELNVSQDGLKELSSKSATHSVPTKDNMATSEGMYDQVRLRRKKKFRHGREPSRLDSMVLLIMKLDQLDQDIDNALTSPSLSRKQVFSQSYLQSAQVTRSGSDSAQDISPLCLPHVNISHVLKVDYATSAQVPNCGAKPKTSALPVISEKEKADLELPFLSRVYDIMRAEFFYLVYKQEVSVNCMSHKSLQKSLVGGEAEQLGQKLKRRMTHAGKRNFMLKLRRIQLASF